MGDLDVGAWCFDRRSEVFFWSPELRAIYGEKPVAAQTGFEHFLLPIEPADAEMVQQLSTRSFEDDLLVAIRYRIRLGDGTTKQLRLRGLAVQGTDGTVERVVGVVHTVEEPGDAVTPPLIPTPGSVTALVSVSPVDGQAPATATQDVAAHPAPSSIFLIEDNDAVRALANMVLSNGGFDVLEASRGEDAVSRIREEAIRPRLVIVDVVLPGLGGIDVAEALWESHPDLPILFLSGYGEADLDLPSRDLCSFLSKPFTPESLLASVLSLLSGASGEQD